MNAWEQYFTVCRVVTENNSKAVEEKFKECESYVDRELKPLFGDCGIVYTKHEEAIKDGCFCIWVDRGSITHKTYKLKDVGIEPVQLETYPIRPDKF